MSTSNPARVNANLTPEQRALYQAVHERSKHERLGPDELLARGEIDELVPNWQASELSILMKALREERQRMGLSLDAVSERSGLIKSMLSELENGKRLNPTLETLYRYALAIGKHIKLVPVDTAEAWNDRG
jgi:DNA-binding XRE family transcriptional regulator